MLEVIKSARPLPPGLLLWEDPPIHDIHRRLLAKVFTAKRLAALEPQVRQFCARTLDGLVGADGFDFVADLGAIVPMRVIGMMLGIPEADQDAISEAGHKRHHLDEGEAPKFEDMATMAGTFSEYIEWRAEHPSDDLMTELLTTEFTDETGARRRLTRTEAITYTLVLAGAATKRPDG